MKETLRDKIMDVAMEHFLDLMQEMTTAVDKDAIQRINDDIIRTRKVLRETKLIFEIPVSPQ